MCLGHRCLKFSQNCLCCADVPPEGMQCYHSASYCWNSDQNGDPVPWCKSTLLLSAHPTLSCRGSGFGEGGLELTHSSIFLVQMHTSKTFDGHEIHTLCLAEFATMRLSVRCIRLFVCEHSLLSFVVRCLDKYDYYAGVWQALHRSQQHSPRNVNKQGCTPVWPYQVKKVWNKR